MNMHPRLLLLAVLLAQLGLSACVPVAVVGGTTAGVMIASDRRSVEQQGRDGEIERIVERRLKENFGDRIHVNANVYDGTLLLTGEIPTPELRLEVDALIKLTPNVRRIVDEIKLQKLSEARWRANDALITANVKTRFGQAGKFDVSLIKVVTESNAVYLMGRVTQKEADDAIEIARESQGVQRVLNVMDVVSAEAITRTKDGAVAAPAAVAVPSPAPAAAPTPTAKPAASPAPAVK
jgi:osmotically-inducible protein OsmY